MCKSDRESACAHIRKRETERDERTNLKKKNKLVNKKPRQLSS